MKKKFLPLVTVVAMLALPVSQATAAEKPTPPKGQMNMSASQMAAAQPTMTGWDMVKMRTTPQMRAKAARNAQAKGKPAQAAALSTYVPSKGPDYFGTTPNYAESQMPHVTWKAAAGTHAASDNVVLPVYDAEVQQLIEPKNLDVQPPIYLDPCSPDNPYQVVGVLPAGAAVGTPLPTCGALPTPAGTIKVVTDPINDIAQLDVTKVDISGGIRKFIEPLSGLGAAAAGSTMQNYNSQMGGATTSYIPVAVPDTNTYPGSDYYEIGLKDYYQQFSPDLAPTKLRGYYQKNVAGGRPFYLGPVIMAQSNRPVRIKFTNELPKGSGGDLFLPVDTTAMGAGTGPDGNTLYGQNRAVIHLHGGLTPWISDGTPHQWTTPVGDTSKYPKGVSVYSVPDMPAVSGPTDSGAKNDGSLTFYYTNKQAARLMWYHDHAYGMTRLNVYAGEVSGYLLNSADEKTALIDTGIIPAAQTPLIIQDKAFVPDNTPSGYFPDGQLTDQDPTWNAKWGGTGSLWFPHVYMPNQNPYDNSGAAPMGRWDYGPWFWPIFGTAAGLVHGEVANPYAGTGSWEPPFIPGTPSTYTRGLPVSNPAHATSDVSLVPESFVDTAVVNGVAYPYMNVDPKAYRFRILNGANDRYWNLQMYCSKADMPNVTAIKAGLQTPATVTAPPAMWSSTAKNAMPANADAGEVPMVPAVKTQGYPTDWPTDGRAGGVPDPAARAGHFLQIGNESGVIANVADIRNGPVNYIYNRRDIVVLNVDTKGLYLGPAERADVIYDFSDAAAKGCKNVILYNDAPTPMPAFDPRNDYYTNNPDQTDSGGAPSTLPGYGPDTRTLMQFRLSNATPVPYDATALRTAIPALFAKTQPKPIVPETRYASAYPGDPIGLSDIYSRIQSNTLTFPTSVVGDGAKLNLVNPGSGYAPVVTFTGGGTGNGAAAVPVIGPNGTITSITVTNAGNDYSAVPTVRISTPVGGTVATATAVLRGRTISRFIITNPGSGYSAGATLTIAPPATGNAAAGTATVNMNTGSLSTVTLTDPGNGYTSSPAVTISAPLYVNGVQATAEMPLATGAQTVKVNMDPKAIQELFEMDYGRMNATLGVELPFTNSTTQTTLPLGYAEPVSEVLKPTEVGVQIGTARDGTAIWKITHNGVDSHTIHFHLMDVQLINRVGWDGAIRKPDDNEIGWKESVRMNPLEDAIVAMRPVTPELPFKIGDSIRSIDPTMPANHVMSSLDPLTGQATTFTNDPVNLGWEYVWHCHLLGHEENDMMRPVDFVGSPDAPTVGTAKAGPSGGTSGTVTVTWKNNANWQLTNFVIERTSATTTTTTGGRRPVVTTVPNWNSTVVQNLSDKPALIGGGYKGWQGTPTTLGGSVAGTQTSFTDSTVASGVKYYYRVRAESANGYSQWSNPTAQVTAPTFSAGGGGGGGNTNSPVYVGPVGATPSIVAQGGVSQIAVSWLGTNANGTTFTVQISTSAGFANPQVSTTTSSRSGQGQTRLYNVNLRNGQNNLIITKGTQYYVRVRATSGGQTSAWVTLPGNAFVTAL